jgi:hypothetical protein
MSQHLWVDPIKFTLLPPGRPKFYGGSTLTHGHQALVEDTSSPVVRTTWDIGAKTKEAMHYRKHRNFRQPYLSIDGLAKKLTEISWPTEATDFPIVLMIYFRPLQSCCVGYILKIWLDVYPCKWWHLVLINMDPFLQQKSCNNIHNYIYYY